MVAKHIENHSMTTLAHATGLGCSAIWWRLAQPGRRRVVPDGDRKRCGHDAGAHGLRLRGGDGSPQRDSGLQRESLLQSFVSDPAEIADTRCFSR